MHSGKECRYRGCGIFFAQDFPFLAVRAGRAYALPVPQPPLCSRSVNPALDCRPFGSGRSLFSCTTEACMALTSIARATAARINPLFRLADAVAAAVEFEAEAL